MVETPAGTVPAPFQVLEFTLSVLFNPTGVLRTDKTESRHGCLGRRRAFWFSVGQAIAVCRLSTRGQPCATITPDTLENTGWWW